MMLTRAEIEVKNDGELVEMARANPEHYRFLMERYQDPLLRFVRRITQLPVEDAEDILQETFVKMYRNLNDYDSGMKFSSWAYRIAHNAAVDHLRKINVRPKQVSIEVVDYVKLLPSSVNVADEIAAKDLAEKVSAVMNELPIKYREVLILRFIEDKSYEEIMDILKKPKGSVATLIDRGRKMLVERMQNNQPL
ncbi:RNA polymerase sigma factor [Patescibacteria group bacterium]|nr:MAG: RNA polymerase sigma factor [Patescibacteria group bacterium]